MAKLRTSNDPTLLPAEEILEALLVEAGAAGNLPTDEKRLLSFLGLQQMTFDFMNELEFIDEADRPSGEIRAAIQRYEGIVATQTGLGDKRTRFCIFHEIAHCVLPEHNKKLFLDSDATLGLWTRARLEREANQFAADLLFQGRSFADRAIQNALSLKTPIELAPEFGASFEAAFRRYTETHVSPCALIVYDKLRPEADNYMEEDDYRLQYVVTSTPFRKAYFSGLKTTEPTIKASEILGANASWKIGEIAQTELTVGGDDPQALLFDSEVFNNGYKLFQFLLRPARKGR
jgi:hypothetical protein